MLACIAGKYSLLLVAELLEQLDMKHSVEIFALESGFVSSFVYN
jgi:hypothetical protein